MTPQTITLIVVIGLIGLFAFQTYIRMKNRVDKEKKLYAQMQEQERRAAVDKVLQEKKEQAEGVVHENANEDMVDTDKNEGYSVYPEDYADFKDTRTDDLSNLK